MKHSEIIQLALDTKYARTRAEEIDHTNDRNHYMCHAIQYTLADLYGVGYADVCNESAEVCNTFMPLIRTQNTNCLTNYLERTDKKYGAIVRRYSHVTPSCYAKRVKFWENLIAELKEKGL